eukprot:TRINITY_DN1041_c0_g1_i1.p1 TRINITY_DN1041_c0_g1~~TRINITY_DN1041_c0_g1_i1.p1  ORF type:complete len:566 (-),score=118.50 TRINITY_DN1041_c0_g1_i1:261-1874(-)
MSKSKSKQDPQKSMLIFKLHPEESHGTVKVRFESEAKSAMVVRTKRSSLFQEHRPRLMTFCRDVPNFAGETHIELTTTDGKRLFAAMPVGESPVAEGGTVFWRCTTRPPAGDDRGPASVGKRVRESEPETAEKKSRFEDDEELRAYRKRMSAWNESLGAEALEAAAAPEINTDGADDEHSLFAVVPPGRMIFPIAYLDTLRPYLEARQLSYTVEHLPRPRQWELNPFATHASRPAAAPPPEDLTLTVAVPVRTPAEAQALRGDLSQMLVAAYDYDVWYPILQGVRIVLPASTQAVVAAAAASAPSTNADGGAGLSSETPATYSPVIPALLLPLSDREVDALYSTYGRVSFEKTKSKGRRCESDDEDAPSCETLPSGAQLSDLAALQERIAAEMAKLSPSGGYFVRLSERSPKDVLDQKRGPGTLRAENAQQALALLTASDRVHVTLHNYRASQNPGKRMSIVVEEWRDMARDAEFRCFVRGRRMTAISQLHCYDQFEYAPERLEATRAAIVACHEHIAQAVPFTDCVMDVWVQPNGR